jgi:hypothetical protein
VTEDTNDDPKRLRRFSVALLGGLRVQGSPRLGDRLVRIAVIGGMNLDLAGAEFVGGRLTIVKVSLIGGLSARVPADARITVHGLAIGGRSSSVGPGAIPAAARRSRSGPSASSAAPRCAGSRPDSLRNLASRLRPRPLRAGWEVLPSAAHGQG